MKRFKPQRRTRVLLYAAALVALSGCTSTLVFQPPMTYDSARGVPQPRVKPATRAEIRGPHGAIETWYWDARILGDNPGKQIAKPAHPLDATTKDADLPSAFVLFSGGNAMLAQHAGLWIEKLYAGRDIGILAWNYPGYGSSTGPRSFQNTLDHALTVYNELHKRVGSRPIILHGVSIGSCPSAYIAANRPVSGVILEGPPQVAKIIMSPRWGWWNLWIASTLLALQVPADFDPASSGRRASPDTPLLIIQGNDDTIVPPWCADDIASAWPARNENLLKLPHIGHAPDPITRAADDYRAAVDQLLKQTGIDAAPPLAPLQSRPADRR